jgi:hypothetical protein
MKRLAQTNNAALALELKRGRLADAAARAALIALPALAALFLPPKSLTDDFAASGIAQGVSLGEFFLEAKRLGVRWGYVTALAVVAFFALGRTEKRGSLLPADPVSRLGLLGLASLLAAMALASALSIAPMFSFWQSQALLWPAGLALMVAAMRLELRPGVFLSATLAAGSVVAVVAIAQSFGRNPLAAFYDLAMRHPDDRAGVIATIGNPEYLGGYLAMLGAAAFALMAIPSPEARRPFLSMAGWGGVFALFAGGDSVDGHAVEPCRADGGSALRRARVGTAALQSEASSASHGRIARGRRFGAAADRDAQPPPASDDEPRRAVCEGSRLAIAVVRGAPDGQRRGRGVGPRKADPRPRRGDV